MTTTSQRALAATQMPDTGRIVSDEDVGNALDYLRKSASEIGHAKRNAKLAEHRVKVAEALGYKASDAKASDARKYDARITADYEAKIIRDAEAAGEYEKLRAAREAAAAIIEAWRSEQANYRSMKI